MGKKKTARNRKETIEGERQWEWEDKSRLFDFSITVVK